MAISDVTASTVLTATAINNLRSELKKELMRRGGEGSV
jgi:hypothetical protein